MAITEADRARIELMQLLAADVRTPDGRFGRVFRIDDDGMASIGNVGMRAFHVSELVQVEDPMTVYSEVPVDEQGQPYPSRQTSELDCPFCGETDFDTVGLKSHLLNWCTNFDEVPAPEM